MKIVFMGSSGVHHPLVAANIFLGRLQKPDLRFTRGFADTYYDKSGFPIYIEDDQAGNQVYSLGVGTQVEVVRRSIEDLAGILGCGAEDLALKPVSSKRANLLYYLGKIPKYFGGSYINMRISDYIIKKEFASLQEEVNQFKEKIYN